jgi:hypothetical protein
MMVLAWVVFRAKTTPFFIGDGWLRDFTDVNYRRRTRSANSSKCLQKKKSPAKCEALDNYQ